jgi:hypothetical protein
VKDERVTIVCDGVFFIVVMFLELRKFSDCPHSLPFQTWEPWIAPWMETHHLICIAEMGGIVGAF